MLILIVLCYSYKIVFGVKQFLQQSLTILSTIVKTVLGNSIVSTVPSSMVFKTILTSTSQVHYLRQGGFATDHTPPNRVSLNNVLDGTLKNSLMNS